MQYTEEQLSKLLEEVETEFTAHLAKAEEDFNSSKLAKSESDVAVLAKAEDEKKPEAKEEEHKEESKEPSESAPEAKEAPKAEAKDAPAEEAPAAPGEEAAPEAEAKAPAAEGEDHCDYDEEDLKHMHDMYSSMSKAELKAHHEAVKKAYEGHGMEKCGDMAMAKSESEVAVAINTAPSPEVDLLKSEVEAEKAKNLELKKTLEAVTEFVTKLANKRSAPAAKAITSLDVIAKSEAVKEEKVLSKGEITSILARKAADPKLEKSDRDAINDYYLGSRSLEKINHLLK